MLIVVSYEVLRKILDSPEKIVAVIAVLTFLGGLVIIFIDWKKDKLRLENLEKENEEREAEIKLIESAMKLIKTELESDLSNHELRNDAKFQRLIEEMNKSSSELRKDVKDIMWYLTNSKITLKGQEEKNGNS